MLVPSARQPLTIALVAVACLATGTATAEREHGTGSAAGTPPRLSLEADDLVVYLGARAQLQIAMLSGDDTLLSAGDAAEEPGFRLRRARLGVEAVYDEQFYASVVVDLLESEGTALHEAYVGWESRWFMAYGGLVKVPMSRSALLSSQSLQHASRPTGVKGIAPFQQLGMNLGAKFWRERIRLTTGFFNGMQREDSFAGGWTRIGPGLGNRFGGFAVAGRLDVEPLGALGSGASDLDHSRSPLLGIGGGVLFNRGETIRGLGFSADLAFKWHGFSLLTEYLQDFSEPAIEPTEETTQITRVTRRALVAQLGYAPIAGWLDVGFRFEMVDENTEIDDEGDFFAFGGTVSLFAFEGHLKVQLAYQHRMEREGATLDNDTFILQTEGRF